MAVGHSTCIRFGPFELDPQSSELLKDGRKIKLPPQPVKVLVLLAKHPQQLVTREEIKNALWGSDTFVDFEQALNFCIRQIRSALEDDRERPQYIETLPRRGYRFIAHVEAKPTTGTARKSDKIMMVVLPFENLSGNPHEEYFTDGMTEETITHLGRLAPEKLGVIARTSAIRYKGTSKGIDEIGRELSVEYALEGSVRRSGERVRVTAQLIQVADQTHLWAEEYDRDLRDILSVQDDIASAIARKAQIKLELAAAASPGTLLNPDAHDAYLKGRYFYSKRALPDLRRAIDYFQQAIEKDPWYAQAYAGLAAAYMVGPTYGLASPHDAYSKAEAAIKRALELEPSLAEAHAALGQVHSNRFEWSAAEQEMREALRLDPNSGQAHYFYSVRYLVPENRLQEAIEQYWTALRLDPLSAIIQTNLARTLLYTHRYDEAEQQCRSALEIDPALPSAHFLMGEILEVSGRYDEAWREHIQTHRPVRLEMPPNPEPGVYWRTQAEALIRLRREQYAPAVFIARAYAASGDFDKTFSWLETAYEDNDEMLPYFIRGVMFDRIRSQPRYASFMRCIGLPP